MGYKNQETMLSREEPQLSDTSTIDELTTALRSDNGLLREHARQALVSAGSAAVEPLIELLTDDSHQVRWEVAKILGEIADRKAASSLVRTLEDEEFDVRWLAAEALIAIGRDALVPLIQELERRPESIWLRQGAHHVLHDLSDVGLRAEAAPVLRALESLEPELEVIEPALGFLDKLKD